MDQASSKQIYKPLDRNRREIRIVNVYGPRNGGLLRAKLQHVSLDSNPKYEAISYCWAEVPGEDYIMLDGVICKAPASAVKVLHQVRPQGSNQYSALWIDAICINQADIAERGHQVQMMMDIYRQCECCLIWLGDYDESVDSAMSSMELIFDDMRQRTSKYNSIKEAEEAGAWDVDAENDDSYSQALAAAGLDIEALGLFLQRPWFSRLWVLQEACLAPDAVCRCGDVGIGWRVVCSAVEWLIKKHGSTWSSRNLPRAERLAIMFSWRFIELQAQVPANDCFVLLLPISGMLNCTEPMDRAFSILGLSDWTTKPDRWPKDFTVDYTQPYTRVLAFVHRAAMGHHGEPFPLIWAGISGYKTEQNATLPSWIPRWDTQLERSNAFYWSPFAADDNQGIILKDLLDGDPPEVLALQGFILDEVADLLPMMDMDILTSSVLFRRFLRSCVGYMSQRSADDETHILHTIARTLSLGGSVEIVGSQATPAKNDEEFIDGVSSFFNPKDGRWNDTPISRTMGRKKFDFEAYATLMCVNKRLFTTSKGYIGMGPMTTEHGDVVAILFGCRVPFVLRPVGSYGESLRDSRFKVNGECYIDGVMFGEAVKQYMQAGLEISTFLLV